VLAVEPGEVRAGHMADPLQNAGGAHEHAPERSSLSQGAGPQAGAERVRLAATRLAPTGIGRPSSQGPSPGWATEWGAMSTSPDELVALARQVKEGVQGVSGRMGDLERRLGRIESRRPRA
jgi:hypothetical protein